MKLWHTGITFEDCTFTALRPGGGYFDARWGVRGDGACADWTFKGCRFVGIHSEHGAYLNTAGDVTFEECVFEDIAAQAVQCVWKGRSSVPPDVAGESFPGVISMRRCAVIDCGQYRGRGRAGFALSFFGGDQDVRLSGVLVRNDHTDEAEGWQPSGALNVDGRPSFVADRLRISYQGMQARPLMRIMGTPEAVILQGCEIAEGKTQTDGQILFHERARPYTDEEASTLDLEVRGRAALALEEVAA